MSGDKLPAVEEATHGDILVAITRLEGKVDANQVTAAEIKKNHEELRDDLREMKTEVKEARSDIDKANGGIAAFKWFMGFLLSVGGLAAAFVGLSRHA